MSIIDPVTFSSECYILDQNQVCALQRIAEDETALPMRDLI